ncbi:MAG: toprim domain-containing protein [Candidatus Paceibacterota bacterium]
MSSFDKLQQLLTELPGIGPRQAQRFATFLTRKNSAYINQLIHALNDTRSHMKLCTDSYMLFYATDPKQTLSPIARDTNREKSQLLIVEKDVDVTQIERSNSYHGHYFVIGGTVPFVESDPKQQIRLNELKAVIERKVPEGLNEIILGLSATPESEHTAAILKAELQPIAEKNTLTISTLGRGLSTGTELEYSDENTIKYALKNRQSSGQ